ncbi:hypothetical protein AVEN_229700-1 [Araneus ventricosus]|uniref:Uncharacterized protein n=1 Tax=Araneus ventricosus TaxID=182803 RepID=A0A4Y2R6G0_ARAVE|nr:hypothetical protein AVEN_229700-1 [Araneus ventricosus]
MESSLAYPRGKEEKAVNSREEKNGRRQDTRVPRGREARHTWRRCAPEGSSLTGATDGEDGIGKLVTGGDAFAVESDGLERLTAEASGVFWTDGAENDFFTTET